MQDLSIEGFRLSPQQKHLWKMQQVNPGQSYCACCSILIEGGFRLDHLRSVLQEILYKYEILRTNFKVLEGMTIPLQVISEKELSPIAEYELRGLSSEEQVAKLLLLFHEKSQLVFDFEQGSLFDVSFITLSTRKHLLLICLPALCADRATLNNLVQEIGHNYVTCLHGKELTDEQQPLQYADIAEWQNELFEGEDAELGRQYWQKQNDALSKSDVADFANRQLGLENPENLAESTLGFKPEFVCLELSTTQILRLEAIAHKHNTSISILLQACWQILLWRLTGKSDITLGTYCDGRNYEELESALGLLSKYLPVHYHLEDRFSLGEVLRQTSESKDEALKWQESFDWDQVTEPSENTSDSLFFPICFEFDEQPAKYSTADISFSINKQYVCFDQFKLKLVCIRQSDSLMVEFHYDSNLFQVESIELLSKQFQALLESFIKKPEATIGELDILGDRDRHQLLIEFNNTQTDYPKHRCIHQLFEDWAAQTPAQTAVVFEDQQFTYAQLNTRANQLARHLQTLGVGPETVVALCVDRSLDMFVGLLGVLKAGGAYLPLDPLLPIERLTFMFQDAKASMILTQRHLAEGLSQPLTSTVCLDTDWEVISQHSAENLSSGVTPENLVYVIYTSGSTGKPKGVAVEHRQLLNYLHSILEKLALPFGASFATVSTFAADLGNTAIFPAFCTGGCLHLISQERATNPEALADYCHRHPISCLKIVPSHLAALLTAPQAEQILPRQCLVLGGEAVRWELIAQVQERSPGCRVFNHYGPTETTVGVLTHAVEVSGNDVNPTFGTQTVPLGRPLANTQLYVLDQQMRPVPIGVPGELYIGGDGLTRGYLNRSDLTAERFIPNPFLAERSPASEAGERLYKTGDRVRYLPNGNLEFLGRVDNQVKVRGFRIELEEIEANLSQHPSVQQAVATVREDTPGSKQVVAYAVPERSRIPSLSDLQGFLHQRLPDYMLPSTVVLLKTLPLTSNGKVDRGALPAPDGLRPELQAAYVAPSNEIERTLAIIWQEALHLEKVGIHDNFFELGGHSLLIIQLHSRLQEVFNQSVPVSDLFQYPTISSLAKYLKHGQREQSSFEQSSKRAEMRRNLVTQQLQSRKMQQARRPH